MNKMFGEMLSSLSTKGKAGGEEGKEANTAGNTGLPDLGGMFKDFERIAKESNKNHA
jgi:hypothetical protein